MLTELILVRHGESEGNVAAAVADEARAETVDIGPRDADVPLTDLGRRQAEALGAWWATLADTRRPDAVVSSPYVRARQTAELAAGRAGAAVPMRLDERLRDRELGVLDRLTARGVAARFPDEAQRRERLGKLYHRPPGGESWSDVALRLRSLFAELQAVPHRRVLVATHDAVILLARYVLEGLTEDALLHIARTEPVHNAAITRLVRVEGTGPGDAAQWQAVAHDDTAHLAAAGLPVTAHPGRRGRDA